MNPDTEDFQSVLHSKHWAMEYRGDFPLVFLRPGETVGCYPGDGSRPTGVEVTMPPGEFGKEPTSVVVLNGEVLVRAEDGNLMVLTASEFQQWTQP